MSLVFKSNQVGATQARLFNVSYLFCLNKWYPVLKKIKITLSFPEKFIHIPQKNVFHHYVIVKIFCLKLLQTKKITIYLSLKT